MIELEKLIRPNILKLKPYANARSEYNGRDGIFFDANENPFGKRNRYPDPLQKDLKKKLSKVKGVAVDNIFIGNGSDEVIDLVVRIFCNPGKDKVLTFSPTYGMYQVSASINDVQLLELPLTDHFQIDTEAVKDQLNHPLLKIIFICSPNNPTGNDMLNIDFILDNFKGIVFVDEAYIDFSDEASFIDKTNTYPNLIVSQTFSKAWGLAAARVGVAYASSEIIGWLNKVKPPYNVSALNQEAALKVLKQPAVFAKQKKKILAEKEMMIQELLQIPLVKKIYPSDANFILVACMHADLLYGELVKRKLITRNRSSVIKDCIRITIGTAKENKLLIKAVKKINEKNIIYK